MVTMVKNMLGKELDGQYKLEFEQSHYSIEVGGSDGKETAERIQIKAEKVTRQAEEKKDIDAKKLKYLKLDVTDYHDYIQLMSRHVSNVNNEYVSMTQYIQRLIEADKQKNLDTYTKLEKLEQMQRAIV